DAAKAKIGKGLTRYIVAGGERSDGVIVGHGTGARALKLITIAEDAAVEHERILQAPFDAELLRVVKSDFGEDALNDDHRGTPVEGFDDAFDFLQIVGR